MIEYQQGLKSISKLPISSALAGRVLPIHVRVSNLLINAGVAPPVTVRLWVQES